MKNISNQNSCTLNHRHSINCIIPPYMRLKLISENEKSPTPIESQLKDFSIDEKIRARRKAYVKLTP